MEIPVNIRPIPKQVQKVRDTEVSNVVEVKL